MLLPQRGRRSAPARTWTRGRGAAAEGVAGGSAPTGSRPTTAVRREVLALLRSEGPTAARDLPDRCEVPVALDRVDQQQERDEAPGVPGGARGGARSRRARAASVGGTWRSASTRAIHRSPPSRRTATLAERRLRALGIARPRALEAWHERYDVRDAGEAARVEGVRGAWRVDPEAARSTTSWGVRRSSRRWTGWSSTASGWRTSSSSTTSSRCTSPPRRDGGATGRCRCSHGDRLVGKIDATADREAGVLVVDAVHEDGDWTRRQRAAVEDEVDSLAGWLGLEAVRSA